MEKRRSEDSMRIPNVIVFGGKLTDDPETFSKVINENEDASQRVVGVRQLIHIKNIEEDRIPEMENANFEKSLELLTKRGLSLDVTIFSPQLPSLERFAKKHPKETIILCHVGTPLGSCSTGFGSTSGPFSTERTADIMVAWRRDMSALAACSNVYVKLSGVFLFNSVAAAEAIARRADSERYPVSCKVKVTEIKDDAFDLDILVAAAFPTISHVVNVFGADRCLWGSNWPVDGFVQLSYRQNWRTYARCLDKMGVSQVDQRKIFFENSKDVY
eukprot:158410_1